MMIRKAVFSHEEGSNEGRKAPAREEFPPIEIPQTRDRGRWAVGISFGGVAALCVFLFLAWIQPVSNGNEKVEFTEVFEFDLGAGREAKPPTQQPKKEPQKKPRREPPKKKKAKPKKTLGNKKSTRRARSMAKAPKLGAPRNAGPSNFSALSGGTGGGSISVANMQGQAVSAISQIQGMQDYEERSREIRKRKQGLQRNNTRKMGGRAQDAQPRFTPKAKYPRSARKQQIEGWVKVNVLINKEGTIDEHEVIAADPEGIFEQAVADVLPRWRFKAAKDEEDRPIPAWMKFTLKFEMED